ncbi:CHAT domain-containing protein [Streptomyces sp. NPDC001135]
MEAGEILRDAVRHGDLATAKAHGIGQQLQGLLFGDTDVRALFQRTRGAAADLGRPLVVRILSAPHDIAAFPWELTLDPEGGQAFLTLAPDVHILRLARTRTYPVHTRPVEPPLRILLVLSSPEGEAIPFDLYEEKRILLSELTPLVHGGRITVDVEDSPSLDNLHRCISGRTRGYHVVHYLGHASQAGLVLENSRGSPRDVTAEQFTSLLQGCPDLRLVVYAGCLTAGPPLKPTTGGPPEDDWRQSPSIADLSARVAAPAVVGMQAVLPFPTQRIFARIFYRSLAGGRSLADAVQLARGAIRGDEFVGGFLDWAVPALFVGGDESVPLLDMSVSAAPVPRPAHRELKLGLEEEERSLHGRPDSLRQAMKVVSGNSFARALFITGAPGLRTPFVARILDDLGDDVSLVLYVHAQVLKHQPDPVRLLCTWITELLTGLDKRARQPHKSWSSDDWWKRVLEELVAVPAVLAFDGLEELSETAAADLGHVFQELALRRSRARLVLAGAGRIRMEDFLRERAARYATQIRLSPLNWTDVERWISWNVPELLRHKSRLEQWYTDGFQEDFTLWARLAELVAKHPAADPEGFVDELLASPSPAPLRPAAPPLRAALTQPNAASRADEFAGWITALANKNKVGGRVVVSGGAGERSSIAELAPIESPFKSRDAASDYDTMIWANSAVEQDTNVLFLDFGGPGSPEVWSHVCRRLRRRGVLLIGVGGDSSDVGISYPGWCPDVLTVGALAGESPTPSATWNPAEGKPEIFASETLAWAAPPTTFAGTRPGSRQAALGVLAAALLVWSVDRSMTAEDVRRILLNTAKTGTALWDGELAHFRELQLDAALESARTGLLVSVLERGRAGRRELTAATGLSRDLVRGLLERQEANTKIRRVLTEDGEKFELMRDPPG